MPSRTADVQPQASWRRTLLSATQEQGAPSVRGRKPPPARHGHSRSFGLSKSRCGPDRTPRFSSAPPIVRCRLSRARATGCSCRTAFCKLDSSSGRRRLACPGLRIAAARRQTCRWRSRCLHRRGAAGMAGRGCSGRASSHCRGLGSAPPRRDADLAAGRTRGCPGPPPQTPGRRLWRRWSPVVGR